MVVIDFRTIHTMNLIVIYNIGNIQYTFIDFENTRMPL